MGTAELGNKDSAAPQALPSHRQLPKGDADPLTSPGKAAAMGQS